jgi:hypothetical protein
MLQQTDDTVRRNGFQLVVDVICLLLLSLKLDFFLIGLIPRTHVTVCPTLEIQNRL